MNRYVNAMRSLALQCVKHANQGHIGMSISAAPIIYTLYKTFINISSTEPKWINRDRLVLSAGHGSMSLYPALHFASLIPMEAMKQFRQDSELTPGHPEVLANNFIDASTGPLGQGVGNAVGMALAETYLNAKFSNLKGLFNHYTYVVVGDGDLQEGVCYEAMSLAGRLKLNKLIMLHDSNDYQLDTPVSAVFNENLELRMQSMGWNYLTCDNNPENIALMVQQARAKSNDKPTFIEVKTVIGEGLSTQASADAHAASVNDEEFAKFNKHFHLKWDNFSFEQEIYDHFNFNIVVRGDSAYMQWQNLLQRYEIKFPEDVKQLKKYLANDFEELDQLLDLSAITDHNQATRNYFKAFLKQLEAQNFNSCLILSADTGKSTNVRYLESNLNDNQVLSPYVQMGIREFAMGTIMNGILYHGGLKAMTGTFLAFSDYMKPAIRLGSIAELPGLYVFSHDSYAVGADGPTHQPVDQLTMLRAIPNIMVWRPADLYETKYALVNALKQKTTNSVMITSRQNLMAINDQQPSEMAYGAYAIENEFSFEKDNDFTIIASGSEVSLAALAAKELFTKHQIKVKVVSCLNLNTFIQQDKDVIHKLLMNKNGLLAIEASNDPTYYRLGYGFKNFQFIQSSGYGRSMDGAALMLEKGFSVEHVVEELLKWKA
ncbi:transketolase [Ureaplasma miroungigenitalium]|uniref:Transketolase n=1 Tax=Ureaplasma miroungigenitalium TaxID=1042321 RepID=A0ABT3BNA3_9BACT|nr:transketolase [Ureaplasma miroungigenitalium]MCV3728709.1 transketolase [Ureaplasma miroungigenitalium]MCV3734473.1 transketolase [Ureaplasma miroungigenitalium]